MFARRQKTPQPVQLPLDLEPRTWGGKRKGAGRKPNTTKRSVPHRARPRQKAAYPLHVTMRAGIRGLRAGAVFTRIRTALRRASGTTFRVVHLLGIDESPLKPG